jgi:hypothetical protein
MQYLQGDAAQARATIKRTQPYDHECRFDAARYAALTGDIERALKLLEKAVTKRPGFFARMLAEPDFRGYPVQIGTLADRLRAEAVERARVSLSAYRGTRIGLNAQFQELRLPPLAAETDPLVTPEDPLANADPERAQMVAAAADAARHRIFAEAVAALSAACARHRQSIVQTKQDIERARCDLRGDLEFENESVRRVQREHDQLLSENERSKVTAGDYDLNLTLSGITGFVAVILCLLFRGTLWCGVFAGLGLIFGLFGVFTWPLVNTLLCHRDEREIRRNRDAAVMAAVRQVEPKLRRTKAQHEVRFGELERQLKAAEAELAATQEVLTLTEYAAS